MKGHHPWFEIRLFGIVLGALTVCAFTLLWVTLGAAGGAAGGAATGQEAATSTRTYEGMITCSRCGARHSGVLGQTASDCARTCVRSGASFALVESDATYLLDGDLGVLGPLAGQRARVVGALNGNTIMVSSAVSGR